MLHYYNFCLAQLIHVVIYLVIVYGLLTPPEVIQQTLHDGGLPDLTGPLLPIFHHRPSYKPGTKSKLSPIENLHIVYACTQQSLNVAVHMSCVNMHCIGRYQLEVVLHFWAYLWLQWVIHCMYLTAFTCLCSKVKRYM